MKPKICHGFVARKAARERHTAATRCNDRSSRSHAVFQPLGEFVHFFWGRVAGGVPKRVGRPKMVMGEVIVTMPGCIICGL